MNSTTVKERWEAFWFRPVSPLPLAWTRILFFGWLFCWYAGDDFGLIALLPPEARNPILLLRVFGLAELPSQTTLEISSMVWKVAMLFSCAGLFTRTSIAVSAILGAYLLAQTHSFYKINHSDGVLVLAMLGLVFARAGDRLSVDRLLKRRRSRGEPDPVPGLSGEYLWPIQMVRLLLAVAFFNAGVSKLVLGGLAWVTSDNLYSMLLFAQTVREPLVRFDLSLETFGLLCKLLAAGTVLIELGAPAALFSRRAAAVLIPSLLAMQLGIFVGMGDDFRQFAALYLFWIPWSALKAAPPRQANANVAPPPTMASAM